MNSSTASGCCLWNWNYLTEVIKSDFICHLNHGIPTFSKKKKNNVWNTLACLPSQVGFPKARIHALALSNYNSSHFSFDPRAAMATIICHLLPTTGVVVMRYMEYKWPAWLLHALTNKIIAVHFWFSDFSAPNGSPNNSIIKTHSDFYLNCLNTPAWLA